MEDPQEAAEAEVVAVALLELLQEARRVDPDLGAPPSFWTLRFRRVRWSRWSWSRVSRVKRVVVWV